MAENTLAVQLRVGTGKSVARKLRAEGRVPAVLYGHGVSPIHLSFDPRILDGVLRKSEAGLNTLIDLEGDGTVRGKTVIVKELQREPVRGGMLHADLFEVDPDETIVVSVPVHVHGTPRGVALSGGMLDHALREVELECLPRGIPDELTIDVSGLDIGESVHVRDLALPQGVELRSDPDLSVASVVAPSVAAEEAPEEEAAAAAAPAEAAEAAEAPEPSED